MLPNPYFIHKRERITHYFANRLQINRNNTTHEMVKTIVRNQHLPTFAVFHYMIPHFPLIYNRNGPKKLFDIYQYTPSNYYGNLAYLDRKIGEIISVLKKANKFENSLIIMTSDHSWRRDSDYGESRLIWKKSHIPLFIKFPYQDYSINIESRFSTLKLGTVINKYLDGDFDLAKAKTLFQDKDLFVRPFLIRIKKN